MSCIQSTLAIVSHHYMEHRIPMAAITSVSNSDISKVPVLYSSSEKENAISCLFMYG
ncbi:hypothetical protein B7P43_G00326 [Cryptotermes secundus]|uniref:Uncharacterized protein n=1 Tax=Cryptotermes secundus TaxID=105785 RepID=A0A2J7QVH4_9NEOP|nr:hypothetical protein B7P43_G00326 [Cryptotermes secundus]